MRICLVPLKTEPRAPAANLEHLKQRLTKIAHHQPDLVCVPECTLTGYLYEEEDFRQFGESIPGPTTEKMGQLARMYGIHLCFGLIEVAESGVYNSAVLLERQVYLDAVQVIGVTTLIVNSLETHTDLPSFGGAMIVNAKGELLAESPHGTDDVLIWEF